MTILTGSQVKALQAYIAERDVATNGITAVFLEAGMDPQLQYDINWKTGEVTPQAAPNRAARRSSNRGSKPQDNS